MNEEQMKQYIIDNKDKLTTKSQGFLNGSAKPGDASAASIAYAPVVGDIQVGDKWYHTEEDALKVGRHNIEWLENN